MLILVLLANLTVVAHKSEFRTLDIFSGKSRIAKLSKKVGVAAAAYDRDFCDGDNKKKANAMDLNTSGGFLLLGLACMLMTLSDSKFLASGQALCVSQARLLPRAPVAFRGCPSHLRNTMLHVGCNLTWIKKTM